MILYIKKDYVNNDIEEYHKMIKILFLIPNLGHGGAEKVLVNLVNNLDKSIFDITLMSLYDEGVNSKFLSKEIHYLFWMKHSFPGVSHIMKIFSPKFLYNHCIRGSYNIVISYLEGQTARIVSGCTDPSVKKICWIHRTMASLSEVVRPFRSRNEAIHCYRNFDYIVSVSEDVKKAFESVLNLKNSGPVLYNTNESDLIKELSKQEIEEQDIYIKNEFKICAMGSLIPVKGFERLINIHQKLKKDGYLVHTYILGEGEEKHKLECLIKDNDLSKSISLLGYKENPYKYLAKCDLFVCSSYSEGFSTAVTEALILGIPVVTTYVSGMTELLGDNEYGIITNNDEISLYEAIKSLINDEKKYKQYCIKARERGKVFFFVQTVKAVENFLIRLSNPNA